MTLQRRLAVVAGVYVAEGYPMGIFRGVWPVYFREEGTSLATIGAISGLYLAWSLKVFWSPLVDRFGDLRRWISAALAVMAVTLIALPACDPLQLGPLGWALLAAFCAASATQDIAIDGYTIGLMERGEEGVTNGVRITAYRVGSIIAGAGLLLVVDAGGWRAAWFAGATFAAVAAIAAFAMPAIPRPPPDDRRPIAALGRWLAQPGAFGVLGFVLLFRVGDLAMAPMLNTFWVDRGLTRAEIAWISTSVGAIATVAGAIVGAGVVTRLGIGRALIVVGVLALASNLGYAAAAAFPETGRAGIYAASIAEAFCGGLAAAGFLAFLMRICEREHAAVQYAALTALYALPGTLAGAVSGRAVETVGYAPFFAATAVVALPAFGLLPAAWRWLPPLPDAVNPAAAPDRSEAPGG